MQAVIDCGRHAPRLVTLYIKGQIVTLCCQLI